MLYCRRTSDCLLGSMYATDLYPHALSAVGCAPGAGSGVKKRNNNVIIGAVRTLCEDAPQQAVAVVFISLGTRPGPYALSHGCATLHNAKCTVCVCILSSVRLSVSLAYRIDTSPCFLPDSRDTRPSSAPAGPGHRASNTTCHFEGPGNAGPPGLGCASLLCRGCPFGASADSEHSRPQKASLPKTETSGFRSRLKYRKPLTSPPRAQCNYPLYLFPIKACHLYRPPPPKMGCCMGAAGPPTGKTSLSSISKARGH